MPASDYSYCVPFVSGLSGDSGPRSAKEPGGWHIVSTVKGPGGKWVSKVHGPSGQSYTITYTTKSGKAASSGAALVKAASGKGGGGSKSSHGGTGGGQGASTYHPGYYDDTGTWVPGVGTAPSSAAGGKGGAKGSGTPVTGKTGGTPGVAQQPGSASTNKTSGAKTTSTPGKTGGAKGGAKGSSSTGGAAGLKPKPTSGTPPQGQQKPPGWTDLEWQLHKASGGDWSPGDPGDSGASGGTGEVLASYGSSALGGVKAAGGWLKEVAGDAAYAVSPGEDNWALAEKVYNWTDLNAMMDSSAQNFADTAVTTVKHQMAVQGDDRWYTLAGDLNKGYTNTGQDSQLGAGNNWQTDFASVPGAMADTAQTVMAVEGMVNWAKAPKVTGQVSGAAPPKGGSVVNLGPVESTAAKEAGAVSGPPTGTGPPTATLGGNVKGPGVKGTAVTGGSNAPWVHGGWQWRGKGGPGKGNGFWWRPAEGVDVHGGTLIEVSAPGSGTVSIIPGSHGTPTPNWQTAVNATKQNMDLPPPGGWKNWAKGKSGPQGAWWKEGGAGSPKPAGRRGGAKTATSAPGESAGTPTPGGAATEAPAPAAAEAKPGASKEWGVESSNKAGGKRGSRSRGQGEAAPGGQTKPHGSGSQRPGRKGGKGGRRGGKGGKGSVVWDAGAGSSGAPDGHDTATAVAGTAGIAGAAGYKVWQYVQGSTSTPAPGLPWEQSSGTPTSGTPTSGTPSTQHGGSHAGGGVSGAKGSEGDWSVSGPHAKSNTPGTPGTKAGKTNWQLGMRGAASGTPGSGTPTSGSRSASSQKLGGGPGGQGPSGSGSRGSQGGGGASGGGSGGRGGSGGASGIGGAGGVGGTGGASGKSLSGGGIGGSSSQKVSGMSLPRATVGTTSGRSGAGGAWYAKQAARGASGPRGDQTDTAKGQAPLRPVAAEVSSGWARALGFRDEHVRTRGANEAVSGHGVGTTVFGQRMTPAGQGNFGTKDQRPVMDGRSVAGLTKAAGKFLRRGESAAEAVQSAAQQLNKWRESGQNTQNYQMALTQRRSRRGKVEPVKGNRTVRAVKLIEGSARLFQAAAAGKGPARRKRQ